MSAPMTLAEKWKVWRECLEGEDKNSIFQHITLMTWDAAIFRLILEGRQGQIAKHPDQPQLNPRLHNFIDRLFFQSQASCIRRLIEPGKASTLYYSKGTFSLGTLLKDMAGERTRLTRETYFTLRKLHYDYQEIIKGENAFLAEQARKGVTGFFVPPEYDWESSAEAHTLFDQLSGTTLRSPEDVISERVFSRLQDRLHSFIKMTDYVDKFIAHAATPESRRDGYVDIEMVTWKHLRDAHQALYEVAEFLALILSGTGHVPLIWATPSMFEYWDIPLISENDKGKLELAWEKYKEETEEWRLQGMERMWLYINKDNP